MSNPTAGLWALQSALDGTPTALTGVDPIRYNGGLWIEQAATNLVSNPAAIANTTGWAVQANVQLDRVTSFPGPLPDDLASLVTTGFRATATGVLSGDVPIASTTVTLAAAGQHNHSWYIWVPSSFTGSSARVGDAAYTAATSRVAANLDLSKRDQWQRVTGARFIADSGDLVGNIQLRLTTGSVQIGETLYFCAVQAESGLYPTSFVEASRGPGYSNSPSPHSRAASSTSISPDGIIDTYLGAIVFRLTPTVETGVEEVWGELGEKGAGTDHIQWGRDSSKHPFVEWSGNDSAYTRITLDGTVDAGDEHFYSIEWHVGDAIFTLYQDALPGESDAIPSPQEDYGGESLTLKASAGGVIYNGILIASERLTDEQRATLLSKENWSMNTLSAPQRRYEFFQLRPGV